MRPNRPSRIVEPLLAALLVFLGAAHADPDAQRRECELGITLALIGRPAAAESVFTSLLSHAPRDPRALTNLGNLAVLRGQARLALAFYARARAADSTDGGILLNQATAHLLLGEEELARGRATEGVRRAGGVEAAASLLGLVYQDSTGRAARGNARPALSPEEMLTLLRATVAKVPTDSVQAGTTDTTARRPSARPPVWRSASARAGAPPDLTAQLYWKR